MGFRKLVFIAVALGVALGPTISKAQDAGALLDLLVRKKLITDQEAEEVRAELTKDAATTSAGKWKLSTPLTEIELYGDARLRYDNRHGETLTADTQQRERERYRLRIGLRGILADDWFFGVRLETSQNPRSSNVTFADDTSSSSPGGGGPFAKGSDGINVGQLYLGYKGFRDITLTAGKMPNPLVTTLMLWDTDINPEGLSEQWKHTFTFAMGSQEPETELASYTKDGAAVPAKKKKSEGGTKKMTLDLFVNFAQFVYDDANPENPLGPRATTTSNGGHQLIPNTDAFMLAWQVGARFTFPNALYAQIAPTIYNYTGNGDTFNTFFQGGNPSLSNSASTAQNQTGINSLLIFDLPMEIGWRVGELPMRLFADFAVNLEADDRAAAAGHPGKGDQRYAYQIGAALGQLKKKGDWQLTVLWQRQDQYSLDPNLVDTEFWDSKLNLAGIGVTLGYMLSDAVFVNLLYGYAWQADGSLGTGGGGDIGINPMDKYQLFQADLNVKF
jgi:Putative porin